MIAMVCTGFGLRDFYLAPKATEVYEKVWGHAPEIGPKEVQGGGRVGA